MDKKHKIMAISVVVVVGIAAFFGGMVYGKNGAVKENLLQIGLRNGGNYQQGDQNFSGQGRQGQMMGRGQQGGQPSGQISDRTGRMGRGGNFLTGEILSKDDKSITIKTPDGSSKIIYFSDSTLVGKATMGSLNDLTVGEQVSVGGQSGTDGSMSAQNIQIRPIEGMGGNQ